MEVYEVFFENWVVVKRFFWGYVFFFFVFVLLWYFFVCEVCFVVCDRWNGIFVFYFVWLLFGGVWWLSKFLKVLFVDGCFFKMIGGRYVRVVVLYVLDLWSLVFIVVMWDGFVDDFSWGSLYGFFMEVWWDFSRDGMYFMVMVLVFWYSFKWVWIRYIFFWFFLFGRFNFEWYKIYFMCGVFVNVFFINK